MHMDGRRFGLAVTAGLLIGLFLVVATSEPIPGLSSSRTPHSEALVTAETNSSSYGQSSTATPDATGSTSTVTTGNASQGAASSTSPTSISNVLFPPANSSASFSSLGAIKTQPARDDLIVVAPLALAAVLGLAAYGAVVWRRRESAAEGSA